MTKTALMAATAALIALSPVSEVRAQIFPDPVQVPGFQPPLRDFDGYSSTGAPQGNFTLPSVGLRRPVQPTHEIQPYSAAENVQPVSPTEASVPPEPENPQAATVGRVVSSSDDPREETQTAPVSQRAGNTRKKVEYHAGQVLSGKAVVYDGHSLTVDGHAIRLNGVDAPGLLQNCSSASGSAWRCGEESFRRFKDLAGGKSVSCLVESQIGDGAAAVCSVKGINDLSERLVAEGMVVPNGHDGGKYADAVKSAKAGQVGVWAGNFEAPWLWRGRNGR